MNNIDFNKFRVPGRPLNGFGLEGFLVGIGKIHRDGSRSYRTLDRPIHNKIVSQGVDGLFKRWDTTAISNKNAALFSEAWLGECENFGYGRTYNPWNEYTYSAGYSYTIPCPGPLAICSYGTGGTATDYFTTLALENEVSVKYNQPYRPNGNTNCNYPYQGTREITPGTLAMRISHISPAAGDATPVKEIGYWRGYRTGSNESGLQAFSLFSRIVLPSVFELAAGERLITTYELRVVFADYSPTAGNFGAGILDTNGNMLQVLSRRTLYHTTWNLTGGTAHGWGFPYIDDSGWCKLSPNQQNSSYSLGVKPGVTGHPAYMGAVANIANQGNGGQNFLNNITYSTTDRDFPAWGSAETGSSDYGTAYPVCTYSAPPAGQHYLDYAINLPQYWPNMTANTDYVDLHYLNVAGVAYRFGHYEGDTWVPQALRKTATQQLRFVFRTAIVTPDDLT